MSALGHMAANSCHICPGVKSLPWDPTDQGYNKAAGAVVTGCCHTAGVICVASLFAVFSALLP